MFPDLARDDVFRLETKRLWLRWPRVADAAAIERYSSRWEVAKMTARIPHPYPPGEAERFIFTAREANALGRDLILVIAPDSRQARPVGMISLESRLQGRLTSGIRAGPGNVGQGPGDRGRLGGDQRRLRADQAPSKCWRARMSRIRRRAASSKNADSRIWPGLEGAPARGGMVPCDRFRLERAAWAARRAARNRAVPPPAEGQSAAP